MPLEAQISVQDRYLMKEDVSITGNSPSVQVHRPYSRSSDRKWPSPIHFGPVRASIAKFGSQRSRSVSPSLSHANTNNFTKSMAANLLLVR